MKVFTTVTPTRFPCSAATVVHQLGADRRRTCPLRAVITGSQGGAAPGTSWHTHAHLDDFFPSQFVLVVELKGRPKTNSGQSDRDTPLWEEI